MPEIQEPTAEQKVIEILLDKPRQLRLDANALALIEEKTGKNVMRGEYRPNTATDIRLFFWACLVQDDPELTLETVGQYLFVHQLPESIEIIMRLMLNADPDPMVLAPFVSTPPAVVEAALNLANVREGELLVDLGCGDGRVLVEAAKRGALAVGVESNEERVMLGRTLSKVMKVEDKVEVLQGNIQDIAIPPHANVVFVYLLTKSNSKLKKKLLAELGDDARVVSHDFPFNGWTQYGSEEIIADGELGRFHRVFAYRIGDQSPKAAEATVAGEPGA